MRTASNMNMLLGSADDVAEAMIKLNAQGTHTASAFAGLGPMLTGFFTSPVGMIAAATAATVGILALIDHFTVTRDKALASAQEASQNFKNTQEELSSLDSQYQANQKRITELNALKSNGTITASGRSELEMLEKENIALETQINSKNTLRDMEQQKANQTGKKYLEKKETGLATLYNDKGRRHYKNPETPDIYTESVTDAEAIQLSIEKVREFKAEIEDLQKKKDSASSDQEKEKYQDDIDQYQKAIDALETDMGERATEMSGVLSTMTDTSSRAYKDARRALDAYNARELSTQDQDTQSIATTLDMQANDSMQNYLLDLARAGKLTQDSFKNLGLNAKSFGVENLETVVDYFNQIAAAADNASESISNVDGTFSGIEAAFQTENSGDSYEKAGNYLLKAKEMVDEGRYNTDDVQSVAKMIGADPEDIAGTFQQKYQKMMNFFTFDESGNMSEDGVNQFIQEYESRRDELEKAGKAFQSTGEAAKDMEISAEAFEILMGRAQEHGIDFGGMIKSSEEFEYAKDRLEELKTMYGDMDDSEDSKNLKERLTGWEEHLAACQDDLSQLDPTITAQILFAYDLAQLEQDVEEAKAVSEFGGDSSDWANTLAAQKNYRSAAEEALGFNKEGFEVPKEYSAVDEAISKLQDKLPGASEEEKVQIQAEISNLMDLQNDLLKAFSESEYTIGLDQDSTAEEWNAAFQSFMDDEGDGKLTAMTEGLNHADASMTELLGISSEELGISSEELGIKVKADTTEANDNVNALLASILGIPESQISTFIANDEVTPDALNIMSSISRIPVEKLTAIQATNGASSVISEVQSRIFSLPPNTITQLFAEDHATGSVDTLTGKLDNVKDAKTNINAADNATTTMKNVITTANQIPTRKTIFINTVSSSTPVPSLSPGKNTSNTGKPSTANGTAHYSGTALSSGNWGLPRSGRTLINELGSEIIVRNGHWFVLNGGYPTLANLHAGDIVFNHLQSADILKHGYVTGSHARMVGSARANGSAGSGDALAIGSAYGLSGRALASGSKSKFSEQFDKIEILVDRMEAAFKRITQSVEGLSYNLASQNAQVDAAISQAKNNISAYQKAYQAYLSKADSVGLSSSWKTAVQQGGYDIQEITDESLKNKINDYKKYYDKALKLQNDIADLQEKLLDLAVQKLKNIDSYYSNRFDYNDDFGYANQAAQLQAALDAYLKELDRQIGAGTIKRYSDEWYDAQKKIADYTQKVLEAQWKKFENAIDHFSRVSSTLEDDLSLKKASGRPVSEEDYQKQIDVNNQAIDESYAYRQSLVKKQSLYDVGSDLYDKLAKEISGLDSDIYKLMEDNEKLKKSIWDLRFTDPFEAVTDHLDDTIASTKSFRSLLDKDAFFDPAGSLTDTGAANLALLNQEMSLSKQKIAEYTEALKKLDEAYQNGILTREAYEKGQAGFLKEIRDAAGDVKDYKDDIIDLYKKQRKAEASYLDEYYEKRQKSLRLDEKYYEFSKKLSSQSKSVNQLKAQIAALQGVKNASAQAQLRRLEQELMEEEEDLRELKRDHANDRKDEGYDALKKQLDQNLDDTLEELTYNSDKQQQVVADMLNNIVSMYGQAYGKIQQIIGETGFAGGAGFQQNTDALGSASGAQGQVDAGNAHQDSIRPSDAVSGVNTGSINDSPSHGAILEDIRNTPDIHNRLVAQITLSASSLSLVQGRSATVSAQIRPTDAANKSLTWTSSDPSVATASGGKITALKAGNATILCKATDGGGAAASLTVRVTAAPAQTGSGSSTSKGTGGIPFIPKKTYYPKNKLNINTSIVDRLAYHDYDSSSSARRKLYEYWGGQGYYSGTAAQNVWLLSKMKSAGYRKGSRSVPSTGRDFIHGGEIIIRKTDGGMLFPLKRGDGVIPTGLTENLWDLAERAPELLNNPGIRLAPPANTSIVSNYHDNKHTEFHFDINIEGNADDHLIDELKSILPALGKDLTKIVSTELAQDYRKLK